MTDLTRVACEKVSLGIIYYQEVISISDNKRYLLSLNIILGNKIVHKIRYDNDELPYEMGIGKRITKEFLSSKLSPKKRNKKSKSKNESKVNKAAAKNAATSLFNEMGIEINK